VTVNLIALPTRSLADLDTSDATDATDPRGQLAAADRLTALTRVSSTAPGADPAVQALALCAAANLPVLLWGQPGIGKSSTLTELARGLGLPLETVIASVHEPSDFSGLPIVGTDPAVHGVAMAPPDWAVRLRRAAHTSRLISSMRCRCRSVNTRCRYLVTKTKCAWSRKARADRCGSRHTKP
jgi:hypothetical protein